MEAMLSLGLYDAEQAASVKFTGALCCFVPVQETQTSGRESLLRFRGAARAVTRERETSEGALEIHTTKCLCKSEATSPDCLAVP